MLFTTHYSLLTTHYSLLTTHYSLLTTCCSLLTTYVVDLDSLGLKHVDSAWSNKKEARASTARLQLALLKTALLLGVEVQVQCSRVSGEVGGWAGGIG